MLYHFQEDDNDKSEGWKFHEKSRISKYAA